MAKVDLSRRAQNGRDRRARSRKQFVEAARALFSARPLGSMTVEEVASAAGRAKGTFHAHFQSLDELWAALAKDLTGELVRSLDPVTSMRADPLERIAIGCAAFIERAFDDPAWGALAARGMWTFPDVSGSVRRRFCRGFVGGGTAGAAVHPLSQGRLRFGRRFGLASHALSQRREVGAVRSLFDRRRYHSVLRRTCRTGRPHQRETGPTTAPARRFAGRQQRRRRKRRLQPKRELNNGNQSYPHPARRR